MTPQEASLGCGCDVKIARQLFGRTVLSLCDPVHSARPSSPMPRIAGNAKCRRRTTRVGILYYAIKRCVHRRRVLSASRAVAMICAELREAPHGNAVFLVGPGELQPEVALCHGCCRITTGDEHPQRGVAVRAELVDARLQRAELTQSTAREKPHHLRRVTGIAHRRISASNSALDSSSSAITSQ